MTERMSVAEYMQKHGAGAKKPSKYRNKRCEVDGIGFDSIAEAKRYSELKVLKKAGLIRKLECQPRYSLYISRIHKTEWEHVEIAEYRADFAYEELVNDQWFPVTEDVKGGKATQTPVFKLKRRIFEFQYNTTLRITGG